MQIVRRTSSSAFQPKTLTKRGTRSGSSACRPPRSGRTSAASLPPSPLPPLEPVAKPPEPEWMALALALLKRCAERGLLAPADYGAAVARQAELSAWPDRQV